MSGLYIHIPFCKQACNYCNFYFSTLLKYKHDVLNAIKKEIQLKAGFLSSHKLSTVYIGGGTPSLLTKAELTDLIDTIQHYFDINNLEEFTIEANPDDIDNSFLHYIKQTPVNRFSLGVQSFFDEDLKWMNRAHDANQAKKSIDLLQKFGFNNISVDLIYGTPLLTDEKWEHNLKLFFETGIEHLSSYCLTVEPKTILDKQIKSKKLLPLDDEKAVRQFETLIELATKNKFEHYEISNFAKNNKYAIHNTNYWNMKPYLGIGPSAHSYFNNQRCWNIANNHAYIKGIKENNNFFECEQLTTKDRFNEYILTKLRTMWGIDLNYIKSSFGNDYYQYLINNLPAYIQNKTITKTTNGFKLTDKGKLFADSIAKELFYI